MIKRSMHHEVISSFEAMLGKLELTAAGLACSVIGDMVEALL